MGIEIYVLFEQVIDLTTAVCFLAKPDQHACYENALLPTINIKILFYKLLSFTVVTYSMPKIRLRSETIDLFI